MNMFLGLGKTMKPYELVLAIETSCDDTCCALVSSKAILAERRYTQSMHQATGGVVPEAASRNHLLMLPRLIAEMVKESGIAWSDINAVAYTSTPGLAGCLIVGHHCAAGIATALDRPLLPINHLEGHIMSALISLDASKSWSIRAAELYSSIALLVSGGHTMIVSLHADEYKILSETVDDAVGEVLDKIARLMGFAFPGARELSLLAEKGEPCYALPMPMRFKYETSRMSFSGLKTAARLLWESLLEEYGGSIPHQVRCNFAASLEEAMMNTLLLKVKHLLKNHVSRKLVVVGGVSANQRLRRKSLEFGLLHDMQVYFCPLEYTGDNAPMIGIAAHVRAALNRHE